MQQADLSKNKAQFSDLPTINSNLILDVKTIAFSKQMELLKTPSFPIENITPDVKKLAYAIKNTMYHNKGVGLAAVQVGTNINLIVIDPEPEKKNCTIMINPKIIWKSDTSNVDKEGCLSCPGILCHIPRANKIDIEYTDLDGEKIYKNNCTPWESRIILHEISHTNGELIIDYLGLLQQRLYFDKLRKIVKKTKRIAKK